MNRDREKTVKLIIAVARSTSEEADTEAMVNDLIETHINEMRRKESPAPRLRDRIRTPHRTGEARRLVLEMCVQLDEGDEGWQLNDVANKVYGGCKSADRDLARTVLVRLSHDGLIRAEEDRYIATPQGREAFAKMPKAAP